MLQADNVRVALTGAVFRAPVGSTAPTGVDSAPDAAFVDLGYISEDGVEISLPEAGDSEAIKAWQNGATVRVVRTPSEENPSWVFAMMETKKEVIETYFGVEVGVDGSVEWSNNAVRPHHAYIIDSIDGENLTRYYAPKGIVTSVESHTLVSTGATVYQVTVEGELDGTAGYNFKVFSTATDVTP